MAAVIELNETQWNRTEIMMEIKKGGMQWNGTMAGKSDYAVQIEGGVVCGGRIYSKLHANRKAAMWGVGGVAGLGQCKCNA